VQRRRSRRDSDTSQQVRRADDNGCRKGTAYNQFLIVSGIKKTQPNLDKNTFLTNLRINTDIMYTIGIFFMSHFIQSTTYRRIFIEYRW
jgi:hypothetical protein